MSGGDDHPGHDAGGERPRPVREEPPERARPARERDVPRRPPEALTPSLERDLPIPVGEARRAASAPSGPEGAGGWSDPALRPYLAAMGVSLAAMLLLVVATSLPAAGIFQIGLAFLAVAMIVRRFEDIPEDTDNPVLGWIYDRVEQLEGKFGVEFYGIAALTAFLRAEADWATDLSIGDLLADPVATAIQWFVGALVESIMNAVWSALWWLQLMQVIEGWPLFIAVVVAGWLVWRVLDISPTKED